MRWLAAAALSCVLFSAATFGTFVPLRGDGGELHHLYAWPGGTFLAAAAGAIVVVLAAAFAIVTALARRVGASAAAEAASGGWLAPLALVGSVALGILPAIPGAGLATTPIGFFFYDLRWWWFGVSLLLVGANVNGLVGAPVTRYLVRLRALPAARRRRWLDGAVFITAVACAVVSTPRLRFTSTLHGDEPKYIRYCEVWYQGGGFDISSKKMPAELPDGGWPALHRIPGVLAGAIRQDAAALASDLAQFAAHPRTFTWNRATGEEGFVRGIHGGVYQIYQPGLSVTLFPAYILDRMLSRPAPDYRGEFAPSLFMTNMALLLMFGGCAIALNHLLRSVLGSDELAAAWSAVAMLTLPTAAFAFQFYPELPGLLLVLLLSIYVLEGGEHAGVGRSAAAGLAAAGIAWLHPRFLLVSAIFAICGLLRTNASTRVPFAAAAGVVYGSVLAFNYHVTGSFLPTALWDAARPDEGFRPGNVPANLLGYALDRTWGLAAHAPILLGVLPGLAVMARSSWARPLLVAAIALALAVPASGHTLSAAGGTPGRLIVAIVPLLFWPIAVGVRAFWRLRTVRACALLAVVLSLDTGLTYNWHHEKDRGDLQSDGRAGWRPNLLFPVARDADTAAPGNLALLAALAGLTVAATAAAFAITRRRPSAQPRRLAPAQVIVSGAFVTVAAATTATAANGDWFRDEYLLGRATARQIAAAGLLALDRCRLCMTTRAPAIDWTTLEPNPASGIQSHVETGGRTIRLHVVVASDGGWTGFGKVRVDFGDQSGTRWAPIVGERQFAHEYGQAGEYVVTVWLQLRDGSMRVDRRTVAIAR